MNNRHQYNANTLVCSCGRTFEQHERIFNANLKIQQKWFNGEVDFDKDFT